ncbi:DHA2 family efflux MFS transporter permease subunit [Verminephrobacter aporrectodeae subsp. tuberculatae]|uniref:MFS transporter n=2 Tax=Verminephrobacter aporrectodeae TaxID=1110389 RepID=UPI0022389685|nr:MFS transporter [Verminephrobacter aporrectodeae]MCW5221698.1 DHA2 family efflux MFS transporter permease subunit [Verminephrobacter aporrectodeae subsp. tuberculatae]MCW5290988.1 DHA2 family efflux MFS transporter permease subunit [Verminephrobacter aporrectodeae subsp. tuberculatae]
MPWTPLNPQRRVLNATSLSYVIVILDTSIVNVALEPIAASLGASVAGLQWVVTAYTLAFASLLLSGGALGDRIGAKPTYIAGLLIFALASALCALAPSLPVLIAARVLQGIGAALLVPCALALITAAYPTPDGRARAIGIWAGFGGIAMAAGPLVGGLLIHLLGWRSIFFVNLPIALVGTWLASRIEAVAPPAPASRRLDALGQVLVIVALALSVALLIEGERLGWQNAWVRMGTCTAVAAWVLFLRVESRTRDPLMPLRLFRSSAFFAATVVSLVSALVFYGLFFLLSLYFQTLRGWPPLRTGCAFLPLTACVTAGSFWSGTLTRSYGPRLVVGAGFLLYAAGFAGLYALSADTPYWRAALCFPIVGLGSGLITPAATTLLMGAAETARAGVAAGVLNASRQTGSAFGVAIFGTLLGGAASMATSIRTAVGTAIALSLSANLLWVLALRKRTEGTAG